MKVLLLGGTAEARTVRETLDAAGIEVVESVAGRTAASRSATSGTRIGGFGAAEGLAAYLAETRPDVVVDATHPFAARMSANAASACGSLGTPLVRLVRRSWAERPDAATWSWVAGHDEAARAASGKGRVLLTVGRQGLVTYHALPDVLARVVDPPDGEVPEGWRILPDRGPYVYADELALLRDEGIGVLVSKDSGGAHASAKLDAAATLGVQVVMIRRPPSPPGVPEVTDADGVLAWLNAHR